MASAWIILSTRWSLSSVQAALNVILSVLGTVGIWSFSRFWWQRVCFKLIRDKGSVPLPTLFTFTGPGEGWDLVAVQRKEVLRRENWHLLIQLITVTLVTAATVFSGPIAKVSLQTGRTVQQRTLQVLQTMKGGGYAGNLLYANVLWNGTIQSLTDANFPTTQILDYVPPSTEPWTHVASEWDPTWSVSCAETPKTIIPNVTAVGDDNIYDPLDVFPAFRDTYDPSWFNSSYRINNNFDSWQVWTDVDQFQHVFFFVLIQSDPVIDNRMYTNNGTLQISISLFHAQNFKVNYTDPQISGETTWNPVGRVGNASYTRTECNITRTPKIVANEDMIPWIWTNDTYSIAMGYRTYWEYQLAVTAGRSLPVPILSATDLFRFYQAYMAATNTNHAQPTPKKVSTWVDTVELSVVFMIVIIFLAVLTLWASGCYLIFRIRYGSEIDEMYIPDSKIEWMIHAAKAAGIGEEIMDGKKLKCRDHFRMANFGHCEIHPEMESANWNPQMQKLARVHTGRNSESSTSPLRGLIRAHTDRSSISCNASSKPRSNRLSSLAETDVGEDNKPEQRPRSVSVQFTNSRNETGMSAPRSFAPMFFPLGASATNSEKMLNAGELRREQRAGFAPAVSPLKPPAIDSKKMRREERAVSAPLVTLVEPSTMAGERRLDPESLRERTESVPTISPLQHSVTESEEMLSPNSLRRSLSSTTGRPDSRESRFSQSGPHLSDTSRYGRDHDPENASSTD